MAQVVSLTPVRPSPQPPAPSLANRHGKIVADVVTNRKWAHGMPPAFYLHAISAHPPHCPSRSQPPTLHLAHKRPFPTHQCHPHTPQNQSHPLPLTAATARWPGVCPTPGGHRSALTAPPTLPQPPPPPPLHFTSSPCIAPLLWHSPPLLCRCAGWGPVKSPYSARRGPAQHEKMKELAAAGGLRREGPGSFSLSYREPVVAPVVALTVAMQNSARPCP